jgi:hypothetical protein
MTKTNQIVTDIILEEKSIGLDKKSLKESSWFGEPKCKLESKVVYFLVFKK